jgi:hypothetical protein
MLSCRAGAETVVLIDKKADRMRCLKRNHSVSEHAKLVHP